MLRIWERRVYLLPDLKIGIKSFTPVPLKTATTGILLETVFRIPDILLRVRIRIHIRIHGSVAVLLPENLHTSFELSVQAWTLYKAP